MAYRYLKFTKQIDRRSPHNEGDIESPIMRENWLSRDGKLTEPLGTEIMNYYESYQFPSTLKLYAKFADTFKDELGHVPTIGEGAYIDKTDGVLGGVGCGVFDGTEDYLSYAASADWYFGTGDFTVKARVKFSDLTNAQTIIGQYKDATHYWYIQKGTAAGGNKFQIKFVDGTTKADYVVASALSLAANRWYDIEFVRSTTTIKMFLDGEAITLTETTAIAANDVGDLSAYALIIGQQNSANYLNGKVDELFVYKGLALHTAAFTLETAELEPTTGVGGLSSYPTWAWRYYTKEIGQQSPKTFCYTQDGKLWLVDDVNKLVRLIKDGLNPTAYPKAWVCKQTEQFTLYMVDGRNLYKYDGNNDNKFDVVTVQATDKNKQKY